ncbi:MAG: hypothetical protein WCE94_14240 [Candidatus Methanoperedens sp.]
MAEIENVSQITHQNAVFAMVSGFFYIYEHNKVIEHQKKLSPPLKEKSSQFSTQTRR